jgi:hypothetical protein
MLDKQDYSNLSLEELLAKQKSLSNWQKIFIAAAVFSVGSALYAIYIKSKMHPWWILGALFFLMNNGSKLKKVEAEIEKRKN